MSKTHTFKCEKLVRDKMPELLKSKGVKFKEEVIDNPQTFLKLLKEKLIEEAKEVEKALSKQAMIEELADVLEVIDTIIEASHLTLDEIETKRRKKRHERGGFKKGNYIFQVEIDENNPALKYFLDRVFDYPEINKI